MGLLSESLENKILFDRKDHELLRIVTDVLGREDLSGFKHLLAPYLHPRGVKEMAATQGLRMAYAAANLLGSLEIGKAQDRLGALRSLRDEVMNNRASFLRRNTARVLLQIMKELVRTTGDERARLELAHDFRMAATGKARVIRRQLGRYRLLEMPEDWVQLSFDNHVHDANTKGRKSATHLIMDAWIKGIRKLTVIYYHFVLPSVAEELLKAAEIMGISVRIGIEFTTRHRDKLAKIIWVPRGFKGHQHFLAFLREPALTEFMKHGRSLARLQEEQLLHVLDRFNSDLLPDFNAYFGMDMEPAAPGGFLEFVGAGQASLVHLGKYIHSLMYPHLEARFLELRGQLASASAEERATLEGLAEEINMLDAEALMDDYLEQLISPAHSPAPGKEDAGPLYCPTMAPADLLDAVQAFRVGSRCILNLAGLGREDVLDILHASSGRITHLEVVNLKNSAQEGTAESAAVAGLIRVVNASTVMPLKRWVMDRMAELEKDASAEAQDKARRLAQVLEGVPALHAHYRDSPLRTSMGSDSTGQSCHGHGMGMVAMETLPREQRRAARDLSRDVHGAMTVGLTVLPRVVYEPRESTRPLVDRLYRTARDLPLPRFIGYRASREFKGVDIHPVERGLSNILIMGGLRRGCGNHFSLEQGREEGSSSLPRLNYLNNTLKNALRVLAGFVPAFLTFFLSKDWWVLAWFGAFIWFAITGLRNIVQSVLGGGGLSRTPLLKWNDYLSWSRICESLLYTGFSVPLLDYFVKTLLLDRALGVTVASDPMTLYTVMALVNGVYICSHNLFRGLPRKAAFWNLLRSALSIPVAAALSAGIGWALHPGDPAAAGPMLQQWAAVISKLSSDIVAGVIEGLADRESNMRLRLRDYREKIGQMLSVQEKLEVLYPRLSVPAMLADPAAFMRVTGEKRPELVNAVIVNSLDFLYFWMYQPRGRSALDRLLREMDAQTRQVFVVSQYVLLRKREISQLFLDGLLGRNFSKGLAFYLDYADSYLDALQKLAARTQPVPLPGGAAGAAPPQSGSGPGGRGLAARRQKG